MYEAGDLLKFSPFEFKNGNMPKPKFFIVLGHIDEKVMMACLPTSKDHVPADAAVERPTFVYGEQVDEYEQKFLDEMNSIVEHLGQIDTQLFQQLKDCLNKAPLLRRKYRKLL